MHTARRIVTCLCSPLFVLLLLTSLIGCGGSSSPTTTPAAAAPAVTSLSPASVNAGVAAFTLTVNGTGFVSGSTVQWNGSSRTTTFVLATQITAAITAADVATAGTAQVTVLNPDGQKSASATLTINAPPALPTVTSLSPATAVAGSAAFTLTVTGTNFRTGAQIEFNGSRQSATTVTSATQVTASIPASLIATVGSFNVDVVNTDTGDKSNTLPFTVTAARPTLTSLSPATATAGAAALTLTVNGTGFTSDAAVAWAGSNRPTTFVSATQLTAAIPATDLANAATVAVDVAQASGRSTNQLNFTVTPVVPTIAGLSPASAVAGGPAFTLNVSGTGFNSTSSVLFNGSARTTTLISAALLSASITAADIANTGTATIDVLQGSTHAASTLSFAITQPAPTITSLSPSSAVAGSADTTLLVNGTGFFSDSVIKWNGTALATTFKSGTLLQATIPAASLASSTTAAITVVNPTAEGGTSAPSTFTVAAAVNGKIVQLISSDYQTGAVSNWQNNNSPPTLSFDGRYVAFDSYASDLVAGDTNGQTDAFLRDTCVGATAPTGCVRSTTRMSLDPGTMYSNGSNRLDVLSNSGRYAGFDTSDSRETQLRDNCLGIAGCTPTNVVVDYVGSATDPAAPNACCSVLSPDARYVLFSSLYTNTSGTQTRGIYVRDTCTATTGCTPSTTQVVLGTGTGAPRQPFQADISTGGRYVLFRTAGNDIIPTYSSNLHLFVEDTCLGVASGCTQTYTPIDVRPDGSEGEGNMANDAAADEQPSFSKDGRYVVFSSTDQHLTASVTLAGHISEVYVRDTCIGAPAGCVPVTTLVSADSTALSKSYRAFIGFRSISEHGRYVSFMQETIDTTINNFVDNIYVRDTCIGAAAGCVPSQSTASADPDGVGTAHGTFRYPSISSDGHYTAFESGTGQVYLSQTGY